MEKVLYSGGSGVAGMDGWTEVVNAGELKGFYSKL